MRIDREGRLHDDDGKFMSHRDKRIYTKGQDSIIVRVMRVLSFGLWDVFMRMLGLNPATRGEEIPYDSLTNSGENRDRDRKAG